LAFARSFSRDVAGAQAGGVIRVGGPNADVAIRKFWENDLDWFGDFPDKRPALAAASQILSCAEASI
jgi:hypothetical protein